MTPANMDMGGQQLLEITKQLHEAPDLMTAFMRVQDLILEYMSAERVTIFQKDKLTSSLVSHVKTGEKIGEIRVPLTTHSIAGYVGFSQKGVCIRDVYDTESLKKIHPDLEFNSKFDEESGFKTKSVIATPVKSNDALLGVFQVLNRRDGESFTREDARKAMRLARIISQKVRFEFGGTAGPYDYLIHSKKIKQKELQEILEAAERSGVEVNELLVSRGGITKRDIGASLSKYYQVPYTTFDPNRTIPQHLIENVNRDYLKSSLWVPIEYNEEEKEVTVLIDNPSDAQRLLEVNRTMHAMKYIFHVGLPEDILRYLGDSAPTDEADESAVHDLVGKLTEEIGDLDDAEQEEVNENEATVIQLVNRLIVNAYHEGASDIHIEPGKRRENGRVRYRIDGTCRPAVTIPATHINAVVSRIKIMSGLDITERRKPQDGKASLRLRKQPIELRVATVPTVNGESVVMRILAAGGAMPIDDLGLSVRSHDLVKELIQNPHGIILVVGPTGSGKTTTLHALLGALNQPDRKILTAEDPVEITQSGMQQVQVKPKIGLTFSAALRSFLRADPDVIMIGEMRDLETSHIAVEASLTGHIVFSTLHTNSAPETVTRLLDLGLDPVSFSDALLCVLAQRLVKTLCSECKEPYLLGQEEYETLKRFYNGADTDVDYFEELGLEVGKSTLYKAVGCEKCGGTGYKGRAGVHELLVGTPKMKNLIYHKGSIKEIRELAMEEGTRTLLQDGIQKLCKGITDIKQVRKVAV